MHNQPMTRLVLAILAASFAFGQAKIENPGFEDGELGAEPKGWKTPTAVAAAGFTNKLTDQNCRTGQRCAMITGVENAPANIFGNLMQLIPADGYRNHRIRLRAAIRVEGPQTRSQMWLRLDRTGGGALFLDNMNDRPITSREWQEYDIEATVSGDVSNIAFGFMLFGKGKAWVDDVRLDIVGDVEAEPVEAPRVLTSQGLTNLTAFTKLYGYVRFFHPSDQAVAGDWEAIAIDGARKVESAASTVELIGRLRQLFATLAPTVQIFETGKRPDALPASAGTETVRYKHHGVALTAPAPGRFSTYSSQVVRRAAGSADQLKPFEAEVVPGITVIVPLEVPTNTAPSQPLPPKVQGKYYMRAADSRATRLGAVVIGWNVFQHFYPYFNVVKTDWPAELQKALRAAATDKGVEDFLKTLQRMVAALKDGHGNVMAASSRQSMQPPLTFDWVEGKFLVTRVHAGKLEGVTVGDRVLKIDGKPIAQLTAEVRELISGATEQWIRFRSVAALAACNPETKRMTLELEPFATPGESKTVQLDCVAPKFRVMEAYTEPRPDKITELEPGILYVDLDRLTDADFTALMPRLEQAKGVIFDMRGYPAGPGITSLAHLSDSPLRSAKWNISEAALPDQLNSPYVESGWPVQPQKPYFSARRVFLIDGRAISYAETVMGIVEHFKLGEIVGEPTAGTNGNVNPFQLPGGFSVSWTGMKVLKHDGSQHHGIGILPTIPASRTRKGVAEGKDEILLRGLDVVKGNK